MSRFTNGVLVGVGLSLLFAPRPGKETRRMLAEGVRGLVNPPKAGSPSRHAPGQHLPTAQEVAQRATQHGMTVPEYVQQQAEQQAGAPPARRPAPPPGPAS